jgi:hypothetical protein
MLNAIAVAPTATGWLTIYPTGQSLPLASNLNFTPGSVVANALVVGLGSGGKVNINNAFGVTHVVTDLSGYFIDPANQSDPLGSPA